MHRPTPNYLATLLAAELAFGHQVIVGVVVFTGGADSEENTLPLGDGDLRILEDNAERLDWTEVAQTTSGSRGATVPKRHSTLEAGHCRNTGNTV